MENTLKKINHWISTSITVKLISIGILILILLIPLAMIQGLIRERDMLGNEAREEVSELWGHSQTITGPLLSIPYYRYFKDDEKVKKVIEYAHFLPEQLHINGEVLPKKRYRGIYEVIVYNANLQYDGHFSFPDLASLNIDSADVLWDDISLEVGIPDMRGIRENIHLRWVQQDYTFKPGLETDEVLLYGMNVKSMLFNPENVLEQYKFSFNLNLNGSKDLQVVPVGQQNKVTLRSSWPDPKFMGSFLPENHDIGSNGFTAKWKVLSLNRNFPQQWKGINRKLQEAAFGVEMLVPVDEYQKTMRSAKYGLMIIVLTFTIFFFVEVLNWKRIHPFQYILVGLALALFYVLLLSIAEHTNFNIAFGLSGLLVLVMVILYTRTVYQNTKLAVYTGLSLVAMYGFIFITIQQQDLALLFGSIGLFIILAVVMWLSRKVNWYKGEEETIAG